MQVEAINVTGTSLQQLPKASEKIDSARRELARDQSGADNSTTPSDKSVPPEEVLGAIKALTENGLYSVRFENNQEFDELIVKVVDNETDEVIRQVPAEEILGVRATLEELRGQIVDTMR